MGWTLRTCLVAADKTQPLVLPAWRQSSLPSPPSLPSMGQASCLPLNTLTPKLSSFFSMHDCNARFKVWRQETWREQCGQGCSPERGWLVNSVSCQTSAISSSVRNQKAPSVAQSSETDTPNTFVQYEVNTHTVKWSTVWGSTRTLFSSQLGSHSKDMQCKR